MTDEFTPAERAALAPYFTAPDGPVFALVNLPEVVKGALFARYSRSPKSLRRLFLDEFLGAGALAAASSGGARGLDDAATQRAERLYERVFVEYGDDSVAQLGGVHLACEGASNLLTKVLEWGRLMAYLEQSTRYIPYDDQPGGPPPPSPPAPRRSTRCAGCCRPRRPRTSGSTPRRRPTSSSCSGCAPTRSPRRARAPTSCWSSCGRSFRPFCGAWTSTTAASPG